MANDSIKWRPPQFSTRDALWVLTIMSIFAARFVHNRNQAKRHLELDTDVERLTGEVVLWRHRAEHVVKVVTKEGWHVEWVSKVDGPQIKDDIWISNPRSLPDPPYEPVSEGAPSNGDDSNGPKVNESDEDPFCVEPGRHSGVDWRSK
jgi:hypothetical protein